MDDDLEQHIRGLWRGLKERYGWGLVDDEEGFLREAAAAIGRNPQTPAPAEIKQRLQQAYYRLLYDAVVRGRMTLRDAAARELANRACAEIYAMAWRLVRSRGYDEHLAEEAAQKVVERLIARPDAVHEPAALFVWVNWQVRDVLGKTARAANEESLDAGEESGPVPPALAAADPSEQIEDRMLVEKILLLLPAILSSFQRQVIDLVVLQDLRPREAAAVLNTTPHHVRVEKSRALALMRGHPLIQAWLRQE